MHRTRLLAAGLATLVLASCTSTLAGRGTGAGAPVSSAVAPSTPASSTSAAPSSTPRSSSAAPSSAQPVSSSAAPSSKPASYVGRGDPNTWCGSSQIAVTAAAPAGGAAAGHNGVVLRFLNNSHQACVLYGYPGVDGTNRGGHSIGHAARTKDGYLGGCHCATYGGVRLRPGQSASALVEGDVGDGGPDCTRFKGLLVTPPNTYNSTPVETAPYSCNFQVHPVVPGTSGER